MARNSYGRKSVYAPAPAEGPGGQQRLFQPPPSHWEQRAQEERLPPAPKAWEDLRGRSSDPGRGQSREAVESLLKEHGVTTEEAVGRLKDTWRRGVAAAGGKGAMPRGQDFYAREQPERFENDAKHFGLPYNVVVGVNAIMSPKTALATPHGYQTNREAAHKVIQHVLNGKEGVPDTGGRGLRANAAKAAELVRQHLANGTHPLDAENEKGKKILSGPKVQAYYSNYMHPGRTTTDIQHARVVFGPSVRSTMSEEELAHKRSIDEKYGKGSPESGRYIPKTPAEQLLEHAGVHEWSAHVTGRAAKELGVTPSELQSGVWHQIKNEMGARSRVHEEVQPLFAPRGQKRSGGRQASLPGLSASQFRLHRP